MKFHLHTDNFIRSYCEPYAVAAPHIPVGGSGRSGKSAAVEKSACILQLFQMFRHLSHLYAAAAAASPLDWNM